MNFRKISMFMVAFFLVVFLSDLYIAGDMSNDVLIGQENAGKVLFLDKQLQLQKPLFYVGGRLFLPLSELMTSIGGSFKELEDRFIVSWSDYDYEVLKERDEMLKHHLYFDDNNAYISLYDFSTLFHLAVVFNCENKIVKFYKRQVPQPPSNESNKNSKKAYLRMEDVSAQPNYSGEALEKLRVLFDYLYSNGQSYYIAWIPLYTNPALNIQNDLTTHFNFYNADFIYTMDYAINHNGHLVLHGLTHQENDTVSGVGCEFGKDTPFSSEEIDERMKTAKEIAKKLGYDDSIFEFPHYASTVEQLQIAEKNFDIIYQQSFYKKCLGKFDKVKKWNRSALYVPTTISFLKSIEYLPDMLKEIDALPSDWITSLFIHPYMDFDSVLCETTLDKERIFTYNENGIFGQLVQKISKNNLVFSEINY